VREAFASEYPELTEKVLRSYEKARQWAKDNEAEFKKIVSEESKQTADVVAKVLERTDLSDYAIGDVQREALLGAGDVLLKSGIIPDSTKVEDVINELIDPQYVAKLAK